MRALAGLFLLAGALCALEAEDLFVVRVRTERVSVGGPARQTLEAVAVPVDAKGLLLVVGIALDPPDDQEREAVKVSALLPDGDEVPAELVAGDADLNCTFVRLRVPDERLPAPVPLEGAAVAPGDAVVLLARHGALMHHAPRRTGARLDAATTFPQTMYALADQSQRWIGAVAVTPAGALVGFVDTRSSVREGSGLQLAVGAQTVVVVAAEAFAELAKIQPGLAAHRAWIGINLSPFDADKEAFFGVDGDWHGALVTGVAEGSPADRAGLRVHDLVRSIGPLALHFERLEEWGSMLRSVQRLPLETPLPVEIVRFVRRADGGYDPRELELSITLEERPLDFDEAPESEFTSIGLRVKPLTDNWRRGQRLPAGTTGVVVTRTAQASPARLAGLAPGDLILRFDGETVEGVESFRALLEEAKRERRGKLVFFVRRGPETLFLALETHW